jgi:hypothetical protein
MKGLSIQQPWAWLICAGYKDVENRTWSTKFRGRIYVHASKKVDFDSWLYIWKNPDVYGIDTDEFIESEFYRNQRKIEESAGSIIGEIDVVDCKFRFGEENDNLYSLWHVPGQYGFILKNPVLYKKPIPYKGHLGFFEVELPTANSCPILKKPAEGDKR